MSPRTIVALVGLLLVGAQGGEVYGARLPKQGGRNGDPQTSEDISASSRKLLQNAGSCAPDGITPNGTLCSYADGQLQFCCGVPNFVCPMVATLDALRNGTCQIFVGVPTTGTPVPTAIPIATVAPVSTASVAPVSIQTAVAPGPTSPGPLAGPSAAPGFAGAPFPGAPTADDWNGVRCSGAGPGSAPERSRAGGTDLLTLTRNAAVADEARS
ncbi:hypothetical protein KFL_015780010 [Klebsormidium nitens]|uniref:Uncharacterized protein n=1 Tax=Klebsormidium nitens TaxID=105231 RepID=A0A1Y1IS48_KLENI|nr:hypothetical protein KFL_015780010 [Klebsormidium nitens]|eukprot:GAQ93494.1 hypothetical protein KFL_015780010 [Klebsormidium nitens]